MQFEVKDIQLASEGKRLIEWADKNMPVLRLLRQKFHKEKPLKGIKLASCQHVTSETANLMITFKEAGAHVILCASNPLSTNDAVAASLVKDFEIPVFAMKGENRNTFYRHLYFVLKEFPHITVDDGADLIGLIHKEKKELLSSMIGSTEETTTGVIRLRAMEKDRALGVPVIAVNDNLTKHLFDNRYGTGQSTIDGILRATNTLIAGKTFVICGYGWCGRGVAMRARGMGAKVIICEVDAIKALEAHMDGYQVMKLSEAIGTADIVVTVTGDKHVVDLKHLMRAKDGVIIANAGHFDVEVNLNALKKMAKKVNHIRAMVDEYEVGKKKIYILAEGRLVNLSAADGHPASVMDMSFAGQALSVEYLVQHENKLEKKVYSLPSKLDQEIARLKLRAEGITIDSLTREQKQYLSSWREGT